MSAEVICMRCGGVDGHEDGCAYSGPLRPVVMRASFMFHANIPESMSDAEVLESILSEDGNSDYVLDTLIEMANENGTAGGLLKYEVVEG